MGLVSYRDHWSTDIAFRHLVIPDVMTEDRFDQLTTHLQFAHVEEGAPLPEDRLWKLRPVVDSLNDSFRSSFVPGQDIAIDESLWKFSGRVAVNATKRATFGLKVYRLCASTGSAAGYTSYFKVYVGQDRGDMPSSTKAVLQVIKTGGFLDQGYQLFVDDWYASPTLFHMLQARKTNAVGKARLNRRFMPKDLGVREGRVDYRSSETGLLALLWKNSAMLSTVHTAAMEGNKPLVVKDYNVGATDLRPSWYRAAHRSRVWYRNVFFFLFDVAIVNAWAIHRALGGTKSQKTFRSRLVSGLMGDFREGADAATRPPVDMV